MEMSIKKRLNKPLEATCNFSVWNKDYLHKYEYIYMTMLSQKTVG